MNPVDSPANPEQPPAPGGRTALRSAVLFVNFFLIVTALYHLKPASRSLILDTHGTAVLPYVWIGSALTLFVAITLYHRLLDRFERLPVVLGTCLFFILILVGFRLLMAADAPGSSVAFYIFVDLFGVVLVEQFWSLTNSTYTTRQGKRWYGLVGTGGLLGGVAGGALSAVLIRGTPLETPDLLLVAALIVGLIFGLTRLMGQHGMYRELGIRSQGSHPGAWRLFTHSRYLTLIAALLLLAQLVSPLVEFEFMKVIESQYPERESRTAALSVFFSILSSVSIAINLAITPLLLRYLGVLAGLLAQPLVLMAASAGFMAVPSLVPAAIMKISDRGLSYSINRASKELLYIPIEPTVIYQAKAWIDMFGYRIFKVAGSALIILLTQWTSLATGRGGLGYVVVAGCLVWIAVILRVHREYRQAYARAPATAADRGG